MPDYRKPIPKSQKEISNNQVESYVNPETGETRGNPNLPQDKREITPKSQTGRDFSRSEQTSFKGDDTKPFLNVKPSDTIYFIVLFITFIESNVIS